MSLFFLFCILSHSILRLAQEKTATSLDFVSLGCGLFRLFIAFVPNFAKCILGIQFTQNKVSYITFN